jgi:hypothetical protein
VSYGRTLRPATGVSFTHATPFNTHPASHGHRGFLGFGCLAWFTAAGAIIEAVAPIWDCPRGKETSFHTSSKQQNLQGQRGPDISRAPPPRGPPTAPVSYHGPSLNMGPNLYPFKIENSSSWDLDLHLVQLYLYESTVKSHASDPARARAPISHASVHVQCLVSSSAVLVSSRSRLSGME